MICKFPLNVPEEFSLRRFNKLTELTMINYVRGTLYDAGPDEILWERKLASRTAAGMGSFLRDMVRDRPDISYHAVYELVVSCAEDYFMPDI